MDNEKMIDLEIEEALEQEQADAEKAKKAESKKAMENFKKDLLTSLKNALADELQDEQVVKIPLSEYISLVYMAKDLDTLKSAIEDNLRLNYSNDGLKLDDDQKVVDAYAILYPVEYKAMLTKLKLVNEGE